MNKPTSHVPRPSSLYIHIPFCKKKCNYCDFVSYAGKEHLIDEYVDALVREIATPSSFLPLNKGENVDPGASRGGWETIYFGGGTPTLLEPKHFERVLETLESRKQNTEHRTQEITIESNPGTADKNKLKELRKLGINRLSIGVQSFNNKHLKTLGRIHSVEDAKRFYDDARSAGFDNINLDLIFALPNQTLAEWQEDMTTALSYQPNHLSTYNLELHEGTPLFEEISKFEIPRAEVPRDEVRNSKQILNPKFQIPNEDEELTMYEHAIETLTGSGFKHYEISNFARSGFECKHNINYWQSGNYLGVGAGAHSHVDGKRWANPESLEAYIGYGGVMRNVERLTSNDSPDATEQRETIFMGLRLLEGLHEEKFEGFNKELEELFADGFVTKENSHIKLTRKGLYLANLVFEKFV
jgi:oxygen-independent coproporphyrinogen-3 oxidase